MEDEWCEIEEAGQLLGLTWRTIKMYLGEGLLTGKKTLKPNGKWAWSHISQSSMAEYQQTHRPYRVCKPPIVQVGCTQCGIEEGPFVEGLCSECHYKLETGHYRFYSLL